MIWILVCLAGVASVRAQDDLPKRAPGQNFDFEPKLMLDGTLPAIPEGSPAPTSEADVIRLEMALRHAQQRADVSEQLVRDGVLARVEAEQRGLQVIALQKQLADAQLAVAAAQAEAAKEAFAAHKSAQADMDAAAGALKNAQEAAKAADDAWRKAEIDAAALDVKRKQKLYSEGVGSRIELQTAESRLEMLTGTAAR